MLSCEFCKISKSTFFRENLWCLFKLFIRRREKCVFIWLTNELWDRQCAVSLLQRHELQRYHCWNQTQTSPFRTKVLSVTTLTFMVTILILILKTLQMFKSSCSQMLFKIFAIFTGKQLCWSLFLITLQTLGLILQNF